MTITAFKSKIFNVGFLQGYVQELIKGHVCMAVSVLAKSTAAAVTEVLNKINVMQKIKGG